MKNKMHLDHEPFWFDLQPFTFPDRIQAVKASERTDGQVVITISREQDFVIYTIDDNGPGVPRDERQRIFTPFFTTKDSGTGLGLAIAHTIAALHGGYLSVDDSPLGGARFILRVH
jgi:signal transduction histidine kinase